jgi:hypothetical protein
MYAYIIKYYANKLHGTAWPGEARRGGAWPGAAIKGKARILARRGIAWRGRAWRRRAWQDKARILARIGADSRSMAGHGVARFGKARPGVANQGKDLSMVQQ